MYDEKKVSISIGGGLGDILQVYLANPESHCVDGVENFPTTNHQASIWFRRLADFKSQFPDVSVVLINTSNNTASTGFLESIPYIDKVYTYSWSPRNVYRLWNIPELINYDSTPSELEIENEYNPIFWYYDYKDFSVDLAENEFPRDNVGKYIVAHPFAPGYRQILPIEKYDDLEIILQDKGFDLIRVGSEFEIGRELSIRDSVKLIVNSSGFIGTHSSMWLVGVYTSCNYGIKTGLTIPNINTWTIGHFRRVRKSAVGWGMNLKLNKTWTFYTSAQVEDFNMQEISDWLIGGDENA